MNEATNRVIANYESGHILTAILTALLATGRDLNNLVAADLAPVDEFHIRGRESTTELAHLAKLERGQRLLDVGCGLGGSVRYLCEEFGIIATGVDLTGEYIDTAVALTDLVGMQNQVSFWQASALELPFEDEVFDVVWTEHVQMNVVDKLAFYGELNRVLRPGGKLVFHDIFQGEGGDVHFPVPWAPGPEISHLVTPESAKETIFQAGFEILQWEDKTAYSNEWFLTMLAKIKDSGPPPLGLHLLLGDEAKSKLGNVQRNLAENRIAVVQAVCVKLQ